MGLPEFENARLILLEEARAGGWHAWRGGSAIGGDDREHIPETAGCRFYVDQADGTGDQSGGWCPPGTG